MRKFAGVLVVLAALALTNQGSSRLALTPVQAASNGKARAAMRPSVACDTCDEVELAKVLRARPRRLLGPSDLSWPSAPADAKTSDGFLPTYRLVVKFTDDLGLEVDERGQLVGLDPRHLSEVAAIQAKFGMRFVPHLGWDRDQVRKLRRRALLRSHRQQPDLASLIQVDKTTSDRFLLVELGQALQALSIVERAQIQWINQIPPGDLPPTTSDMSMEQGYLDEESGLFVRAAWEKYGVTGQGVRVTDCEFSWYVDHEEFNDIELTVESGQTLSDNYADHGTAVMGIVAGQHSGYGVEGIAPDATCFVYPEVTAGGAERRVEAVTNAIADSALGDIVMLEQQAEGPGGGYAPAEIDMGVWMATKMGSDAGVIVIGAAGNGTQNLDSTAYAQYREWGDSGAIIVGAGANNSTHSPMSFSTYGERVNVQGWGTGVTTTGYGDAFFPNDDVNQSYTYVFNGTSSATPTVVGVATLIQGYAKQEVGQALTPSEMRKLLIDTGTPQSGSQHIGPLPNALAALDALVQPEKNPPTVEIIDPSEPVISTEVPLQLKVEVEASDDSGKLKQVHLEVDGTMLGDPDGEAPYIFDIELLEEGMFEVVAVATDRFDNVKSSQALMVTLGSTDTTSGEESSTSGETSDSPSDDSSTNPDDESSATSTDDDDDGSDDDDAASGDDDDDGSDDDDDNDDDADDEQADDPARASGCGCTTPRDRDSSGPLALLTMGLLALRRRPGQANQRIASSSRSR